MTTSKTAQQAIADLSETLEYSIECGYVQHAACSAAAKASVRYAERVAGLEGELAALRERVASAVETLQRALEALRGN